MTILRNLITGTLILMLCAFGLLLTPLILLYTAGEYVWNGIDCEE
jgi:hypothetical protein